MPDIAMAKTFQSPVPLWIRDPDTGRVHNVIKNVVYEVVPDKTLHGRKISMYSPPRISESLVNIIQGDQQAAPAEAKAKPAAPAKKTTAKKAARKSPKTRK
jgi:hypothetical protein